MWLKIWEIVNKLNIPNISERIVRNYLDAGKIPAEFIKFKPLRIWWNKDITKYFADIQDSKYNRYKNSNIIKWTKSTIDCYKSNYDCDHCIYPKLESIKTCRLPDLIQLILEELGEPPEEPAPENIDDDIKHLE